MGSRSREDVLGEIRRRHEQGDRNGAATDAIRLLGPEIFGLLLAFHRNEEDASEVFSLFTEQLWRGLPNFAWNCSLRTWAYAIARNASLRFRRDVRRRAKRWIPLSSYDAISNVAEEVRTTTLAHLRTDVKSRFARLREDLPREEQEILVLRVDKQLAWDDLARVLWEGDEPPSEEELKRESVRLRKRFQTIKERLRELWRRDATSGSEPTTNP